MPSRSAILFTPVSPIFFYFVFFSVFSYLFFFLLFLFISASYARDSQCLLLLLTALLTLCPITRDSKVHNSTHMQWQWHVNGVSTSSSSSSASSSTSSSSSQGYGGSDEWNVEDETWIVRGPIDNNDNDDDSDSGGSGSWANAHVTEEVLLLVLLVVVVVLLLVGAQKFGLLGNSTNGSDQGTGRT